MKIQVIFYSTYGHMYQMAKAAAEGAKEVAGAEVSLLRIPETLPNEVLEKMGALEAQKQFADVPVATVEQLEQADGFMFGVPTKYGNMAYQVKQFLDQTGALWARQALGGKPAGVMSSSATQHGGQEAAILATHVSLMHHGLILVGLPYSYQGQMGVDEVVGGSPYGASTITGGDGSRMPSKRELDAARFQGKRVAEIAKKLKA
ncbi:MAG TPA: NAD(P)H:quinone oxidoreductase [Spirochaetia bacterium]|nr:NAD(P)H:quinone oxidoreductase [Spirochaetia bacterium]